MSAIRRRQPVLDVKKSRNGLALALGIFLATSALAVAVNYHSAQIWGSVLTPTSRSISFYVGWSWWTALVFLIGNIFVVRLMGRYLWKLGKSWAMPRFFFWIVTLMCVGLITLSFFPLGLGGAADFAHKLSSRTMFVMMGLTALLFLLNKRTSRETRWLCGIYIVYALICVAGWVGGSVRFLSMTLVAETLYIVLFMGLLMACKKKS